MATTQHLSRLMRISWDIQKARQTNRSRALHSAWTLYQNEDIAVQYLTRRLNHNRPVRHSSKEQLVLFNHS